MMKIVTQWMQKLAQLKIVLLGLSLLFASASFSAQHSDGNHLLWQVTGNGQQGYLLGSIHFGVERMYPLADVVVDAFEDSSALVVEINIFAADPLQAAQLMLSKGMYPSLEKNLKTELSPSNWQALTAAAERFNLPIEYLQQQKPWLAALTLSVHAFQKMGFSEELGIDLHFLKLAQNNKPIIELESAEQQLAIFEHLSAQEQEAMLVQTLVDLDNSEAYVSAILNAWLTGDAPALDQLFNDTLKANPETKRMYQMLLVDRNINMTAQIVDLMTSGERPFVVVGAGHMVGSDSIVALLRAQGYHVEQQ